MSLLSSTTKVPISGGNASAGIKVKRKSRRHRTTSPPITSSVFTLEPEESDRPAVDGTSRERIHFSRRVSRGVVNDNMATETNVVHTTAKRKQNGSGGSSRRTPSSSHHRHSVTTATGASASISKRHPRQTVTLQEACIAARRSLTSSASSVRPPNRKRIDDTAQVAATEIRHRYSGHRRGSQSNNNEQDDDANEEDDSRMTHHTSTGAGPESFSIPNHEDWLIGSSNNNQNTARIALPSRASKYRNLSAGVNKKPRARVAAVPAAQELVDRPPSRQRHAFPTHLIDTNAFDAPETTSRRGGSSSSSSSASSSGSSRQSSSSGISPPSDAITSERPPSRYMVKAKRQSPQGIVTGRDSGVAPSRRGVVDKNTVFSCNQAHHDPKTDGFAEVDESVPPPFRIEITTNSNEVTLDSPSDSSPGASSSQNARYGRRWPSFSNQEQLLRMAVKASDSSRGSDQSISDLDARQRELQWFGKDDQINNAHLFETIISMPSPRPRLESDGEVAIEDDLEDDSDDPQYHTRKLVGKQQQPQQEPHQTAENHFPSRRAAVASKMVPMTTISVSDNPDLHWIRSSTNPFFVGTSASVDYDSMDPETAIEQTPLYSSEDLMTLAATKMSDLHLDDYTALGDASMPLAPPPSTSGMGWGGSRLLPSSRSPPLRTSLGKDFLSLFAQH